MLKNSVLFISILLSGCAYNQVPVVGPHDKSAEEFQQDMQICHQYAEQVDKAEASRVGAMNGAVAGAAVGVLEGFLLGDRDDALIGATAGGVIGATAGAGAGAMKATEEQSYVLRRCLKSKGYDVFDLRE